MDTIYITSSGELLKKDHTLILKTKKEIKTIPIENVDDIKIFSDVTVNKNTLSYLTKYRITVHFFNYYGNYIGSYYPLEQNKNGQIFLNQVKHYLEIEKRHEIAKTFVFGAAQNIKVILNKYLERISSYHNVYEEFIEKLNKAETIEQIMSTEAHFRKYYYSNFDRIINKNSKLKFEKRTKQPPENEINSMISFGNVLLYSEILKAIFNSHLDPRIAYLHSTNERAFTLNLDVAEIFKPIIIDDIIFKSINGNIFNSSHFQKKGSKTVYLNEKGKKIFIRMFDEKLKDTVKIDTKGRYASYKSLLLMEVYKLEHHLLETKKYIPYIEGVKVCS